MWMITQGLNTLLNLERYRLAKYKDGGRGPHEFDCYGLVRDIGWRDLGWVLLPSYGFVSPFDKPLVTSTSASIIPHFQRCELANEVVAAGYTNNELQHVGLVVSVDNSLQVFNATEGAGICYQTLEVFHRIAGQELRFFKYVD